MAQVTKAFVDAEKYRQYVKKLQNKGTKFTTHTDTVVTEKYYIYYDNGKGEEDDSLSGNDTEQSEDKEE